MGNKLVSCCHSSTDEDEARCCCFGQRRGNMKGGKMVPADLHSSGAQENQRDSKKKQVSARPNTLQTESTSVASTSGTQNSKPKFSEFSLHGIQKTSPVEQSDESLNTRGRSFQHRFLVENVSTFFNAYKDNDCDEILADGVAKFCSDLDVDPAEFIILALAWKFKAATMCKFTREEFTQGCIALQADSITSLKESFPRLEEESVQNYKDVYKFAFQFGLDSEQGQRSLPSDVAVGMWQVVFSKNPPVLLNDWIKFLEESQIRGISRDTWNMFLHFTENVGSDLSNYDDNEAWPSLFDDFVEYCRSKKEEDDQEFEEQNSTQGQKEQGQVLLLPEEKTEFAESSEPTRDDDSIEQTENVPLNIPGTVLLKDESEMVLTTDDAAASKESVGESSQSEKEQSSEFDSEPIRCETLHSSHLT